MSETAEAPKADWKEMAGQSSRMAALNKEVLRQFVLAGRKLLDTLPEHWHDDAVVEFRDLIEAYEPRPTP